MYRLLWRNQKCSRIQRKDSHCTSTPKTDNKYATEGNVTTQTWKSTENGIHGVRLRYYRHPDAFGASPLSGMETRDTEAPRKAARVSTFICSGINSISSISVSSDSIARILRCRWAVKISLQLVGPFPGGTFTCTRTGFLASQDSCRRLVQP